MSVGDTLFVNDEQMRITAVTSGTALTVVRDINGTVAAAHAVGAEVRAVFNSDAIRRIRFFSESSAINRYVRVVAIVYRR